MADECGGVAHDEAGNVYVTGNFSGTADFYRSGGQAGVPGLLTSAGERDAFILKLLPNGSLAAARGLGGASDDFGTRVAVDSTAGTVYFTGYLSGTATFGNQQLTSAGAQDVFLSVLGTSDLGVLNAYRAGGPSTDYGVDVTVDADGMVYNVGQFQGSADFPTGHVRTFAGLMDIFVMKFNPDRGSISGNVFADLDADGNNDDGVATPPGTIVYCDLDNDATRDSNEPSAVTNGASGTYTIVNLAYDDGAGDATYAVRQDALPAGWSQTYPAGGAAQSVTLSPTAKNATGKNFGNDFTTENKFYENKTKYTIKDNSVVSSKITVADSYSILDLNVKVNVSHPSLADLKFELVAPDGATILLANIGSVRGANLTNTTFDDEAATLITSGTAPYTGSFRPGLPLTALDLKNIQGTWTLRVTDSVKNRKTGTLNSWSLTAIRENPPALASASLTDAALASLSTPQRKTSSAPGAWTPELADLALMGMVAET